jgi:hypothetical protein
MHTILIIIISIILINIIENVVSIKQDSNVKVINIIYYVIVPILIVRN